MGKVRERMTPDERGSAFWLQLHLGRYVFAAQFIEGKVILDMACGTGYGSSYLMNKGAKVVGSDYSEEAMEYARLHYQKGGLYFLRSDAQQMPFANNSFDVVVSLETIEHLERYEDFLKECKRVLKDDGAFICSTPNRKAKLGKYPAHFKEFSMDEFYELMARYFGEVKLYGQDFLKKADMLKRESVRILMPIIRFIPQSVKDFLRRFILREQCSIISLKEVDPGLKGAFDEIVEQRYIPSLLTRSYPIPGTIVAVGRKRDG